MQTSRLCLGTRERKHILLGILGGANEPRDTGVPFTCHTIYSPCSECSPLSQFQTLSSCERCLNHYFQSRSQLPAAHHFQTTHGLPSDTERPNDDLLVLYMKRHSLVPRMRNVSHRLVYLNTRCSVHSPVVGRGTFKRRSLVKRSMSLALLAPPPLTLCFLCGGEI